MYMGHFVKKGNNLPVINNWIKCLLLNKNVQLYGSKIKLEILSMLKI